MSWATNLSASSKKQGDWIMLFSSCILVTLKFAGGRQVCRPSCAVLGLKDWASVLKRNLYSAVMLGETFKKVKQLLGKKNIYHMK
jgi:hypothetical protein